MKNMIKLSSAIALLATAPLVSADTIFGIYAGAGIWQTEYEGEAADTDRLSVDLQDDLGFKEEDSNFFYVALEHPVPIIPNIKLQKVDISDRADGRLTVTTTIDDEIFIAGQSVSSNFDLSHTDATLYYEVLDNWLNLDIGITGRMFDGEIEVSSLTQSASLELDDTLPMLYVKGQFNLPLTGAYAAGTANWISYDGNTVTDLSAALGWMSDGWVLDFGFEVGLRTFNIELDDLSDIDADIEMSGAYGALTVHF